MTDTPRQRQRNAAIRRVLAGRRFFTREDGRWYETGPLVYADVRRELRRRAVNHDMPTSHWCVAMVETRAADQAAHAPCPAC